MHVHVHVHTLAATPITTLRTGPPRITRARCRWKLWKAADDAGLRMAEYFKYLLLLKGNYECSPATMAAVIAHTCSLRGDTFVMNGFRLVRST